MESSSRNLKEVCLEITDTCPMNCMHCSGNCGLDSRSSLSANRIIELLEELSDLGCESVKISGGEPLMYARLHEVIKYAEGMGLETVLYTSGSTLNSQGRVVPLGNIEAEKLCHSGLRKIICNLQGASPETHEAITQVKGCFRNAIRTIETAKWLGFWVGVHFVPMRRNFRELEELIRLCNGLEVDEIGILRFVPQGRGKINRALLELKTEELREFNEILLSLTAKFNGNVDIRVGRPIDFRNLLDSSFVKPICDAGISRCTITPNGSVVPCPAFKQQSRYVAGNINQDSLADIWNRSIVWREFRCFNFEQIDQPCKGCKYLHQCRGGCSAQRILENSELYAGPDPGCFMCAMSMETICSSRKEFQ